jgi:hypothetical protein
MLAVPAWLQSKSLAEQFTPSLSLVICTYIAQFIAPPERCQSPAFAIGTAENVYKRVVKLSNLKRAPGLWPQPIAGKT